MFTKIYPDNPSEKELQKVVDSLRQGEVVIYPTDSVYAIGCALGSARGIEKLKRLKGNSNHSILCESISQISDYCRVDNATFKILKRNLPGAFTFILNASKRIPAKTLGKRKTIGVRIPNNAITLALIRMLGEPLASVSVKEDLEEEYKTDPSLLEEYYHHDVEWVIDGGIGLESPSTVVDLTGEEAEIIRQGEEEVIL